MVTPVGRRLVPPDRWRKLHLYARVDRQVDRVSGVLTLEAEARQESKEEDNGKVLRQERRYGKLLRSFNLGGDVHEEDISASFEDGVLALRAPKLREIPPRERRIEIQ